MVFASIIIPTFNEGGKIGGTLDALRGQGFKDFEVIVVDDSSTDNTLGVVRDFEHSLNLKHFSQSKKGPAAARNLGARNARGEILVFLDADCVPEPNWLEEMLKPFDDNAVSGVQGTYETLNREFLVARYVGYEIEYRHEGMKKKGDIDFIGTFSAAYRNEVFLKSGGFNSGFRTANNEDIELSFRLRKLGCRFVFNPRAVVHHPHPRTILKFLRQQFHRAFWRIPLYKKHREKFLRDSYSGNEIFVQTGLVVLVFLSFLTLNPLFPLFFLSCLFISNLPIALFCFKKEKKFLLIAPFIASFRSVVGILGASFGGICFMRHGISFDEQKKKD